MGGASTPFVPPTAAAFTLQRLRKEALFCSIASMDIPNRPFSTAHSKLKFR
jgi:hypothetical protein